MCQEIRLSNQDDAQIPQWMEGQLKWVVSLLVVADERERTMFIKVGRIK